MVQTFFYFIKNILNNIIFFILNLIKNIVCDNCVITD
jgi:hypothetical protein